MPGFSRRDIPDSANRLSIRAVLSIGALLGVGGSMSVMIRSTVSGRLAI